MNRSHVDVIKSREAQRRAGQGRAKPERMKRSSSPQKKRNEIDERMTIAEKRKRSTSHTAETFRSMKLVHICQRHFHPGEVCWGCLEAECGIEGRVHIVVFLHEVIFSSEGSLKVL